jgi:two-component system LytT family response regulator
MAISYVDILHGPAEVGESRPEDHKLLVKMDTKLILIEATKIIGLDAVGTYTRIHLSTGAKFLASKPLSAFQRALPSRLFFRVHNSHIINLCFVSEYNYRNRTVKLGDKEFPVSRRRRKDFICALGVINSR